LLVETDESAGNVALEKLKAALLSSLGTLNWPITISGGALTFIAPEASVEDMIHSVDELMFAAKKAGKNRVVVSKA
jgi:PleD family two-component response regulator